MPRLVDCVLEVELGNVTLGPVEVDELLKPLVEPVIEPAPAELALF